MLKKRMTNYGTKAKKLWMRQNAPAVIAEYQKLVRQQHIDFSITHRTMAA